ncbi:hypothetical protein EKH77_04425 [Streptomyces luteoverticillatus]|uniref:Terpene synthase n=1 Tax=Streptomyces luteoverticillatus TaxID=66425 RepID=A0A3S9PDX3_STRLT|nr:hypothetical protein [Streptomyces luteoverticillatus]AZQ70560.1 hypothetical protein EKH77_04425 [Streptomyces luteoverticillatus]
MSSSKGAEFSTPWPLQDNPHIDHARKAAVDWMQAFGLLQDQKSVEEFTTWKLAEVAGWFYPHADMDQCATAAQMMGWFFLPFDDQLDGRMGRTPQQVSEITSALIGIVHGEPVPAKLRSPTVLAFTDLWARMTRGTSRALYSRIQHHWTAYFSSQLTETLDRASGYVYADLEAYFDLRAATACCFGEHDLAEHWGGTEVPAQLWHHPLLARMRKLGADLVGIRNDSLSLPHEDVDGVHNAIHIIERTCSCTRERAIERASTLAQNKADELVFLEQRDLPRLLQRLNAEQRHAVLGYAEIVHNWIVGDYEWEQATARYASHREMPEWAADLLTAECARH